MKHRRAVTRRTTPRSSSRCKRGRTHIRDPGHGPPKTSGRRNGRRSGNRGKPPCDSHPCPPTGQQAPYPGSELVVEDGPELIEVSHSLGAVEGCSYESTRDGQEPTVVSPAIRPIAVAGLLERRSALAGPNFALDPLPGGVILPSLWQALYPEVGWFNDVVINRDDLRHHRHLMSFHPFCPIQIWREVSDSIDRSTQVHIEMTLLHGSSRSRRSVQWTASIPP